jgi:ribose 5-phosphate isomerase B
MIYLGTDHRGFQLKEALRQYLGQQGYEVEDLGAFEYDQADDYPDFALAVAEKVGGNPNAHKGILVCGSGQGIDIVANKFPGIRAALCWNPQVAAQSREHEDANVLVLPSDHIDEVTAKDIVLVWLGKQFDGAERNIRRLGKIREIEERNFFAEGGSASGGK